MKKLVNIFAGLVFLILLTTVGLTKSQAEPPDAMDITPAEVKQLAEEAVLQNAPEVSEIIPYFYGSHPTESKTSPSPKGVDGRKAQAPTVGEPFRIHWLDLGKLRSRQAADLSSIIYPTNEWWVPLIIGNELAGIVKVNNFGGAWHVSGGAVGGSLSEEIGMNAKDAFRPGYGKNKFVRMPSIATFTAVDLGGSYKILFPEYIEKGIMLDKSKKDADGLYDEAEILKYLTKKATFPTGSHNK